MKQPQGIAKLIPTTQMMLSMRVSPLVYENFRPPSEPFLIGSNSAEINFAMLKEVHR